MADEADWRFLVEDPPFAKNAVNTLGKYYSGKRSSPPDSAADIITWYRNLGERTRDALTEFLTPSFAGCSLLAANTRVKTGLTIADKIKRQHIQLSNMFDFVGVRLEWDCYLSDLMSMAEHICDELEPLGAKVEIKDYREKSQHGYRAVHCVITSRAGRIEVQLRTLFQSRWANAFEILGDIAGRSIRYQDDPILPDKQFEPLYHRLLDLSEGLHRAEQKTEESTDSMNRALRQSITKHHRILIEPKFHELRSQSFRYLAESELAQAKAARANLQTLDALQGLLQSLNELRKVVTSQEGRE
ncbi:MULTISPECIES: hypothetical protein [Corynebacterium]|uniref:hypothetical protein n=1 Tax=Corynebacterium TaxID=1716 RepID=UPI001E48C113|nr:MULTISPECIES: hypothetical protein [Corynebacterium]MDK6565929.1 hypothetical protein [Corynebacterium pyruviciproducens]MDU3078395.1 hypothetical protein [Mixta calida]